MSDDRLRAALRELGDVPPTADLASAALRRLEHDRRRARIALVVGVVLAVTVVLVVPATLRGRNQAAPPAAPPASITGPAWVSAYYVLEDQFPGYVWRVYDPAVRGYRDVPAFSFVSPSPDGKQALIELSSRFAVVPIARIDRPRITADILPELTGGEWTWSPDSTKLLETFHRGKLTAALVFDVRTRTLTRIPLHLDPSVRLQQLGWAPDGGFVVTTPPQFSIKMQPQQRTEVDLLDPGGRITRRLFLAKVDEFAPSPDGTMALLSFSPTINNELQQRVDTELLDLRTGKRTPAQKGGSWAYGHRLVYPDPSLEGSVNPPTRRTPRPTSAVVVDAATGKELLRIPMPVPHGGWVQYIDVSAGPVPPGAIGL